ncbi:hypothetical protein SADUNF_Sadunf17G0110100 [Salix dunnii]|uniref:non-specific serine/threonine protein kinase n=1 Tax=Salix dunnii TaxID=1413687 RepID=A0A835MEZ2_9ROSI|nr:hypothetical protein SADUNF_Sadunf17G0110100 [Salix dunnii]
MNINQVAYRVFEINRSSQILRIAREDYSVGLCPPQFMNSFNPKIFEPVEGYNFFTFIYGCKDAFKTIRGPKTFTCKINDVNGQNVFKKGDNGPEDCNGSVFVPVSITDSPQDWDMEALERKMEAFEDQLRKGFEVRWKVEMDLCWECYKSAGVCGFDNVANQTTCYYPVAPVSPNSLLSSPISTPTCLPCSDNPVDFCSQTSPVATNIPCTSPSSSSIPTPLMTTSTNLHPMVTRRKAGISKPKAYHALTISPSSQFFQHGTIPETTKPILLTHNSISFALLPLAGMNSSVFSFLSDFVFLLLLFIQIPSSLSDDNLYTACSKEFVCGGISAGFPFWGNGRPSECGIPELELKCHENNSATMNISQVAYRVLEINREFKILRIAREDYSDGLCKPHFMNSTFNLKIFELIEDYRYFTLIYGCEDAPITITGPRPFKCKINEVDDQRVYIQKENGPGECNGSVTVPVYVTYSPPVGNMPDLEEQLKEGCKVRWKDDMECWECKRRWGVCGFNNVISQPTCYNRAGSVVTPGNLQADPEIEFISESRSFSGCHFHFCSASFLQCPETSYNSLSLLRQYHSILLRAMSWLILLPLIALVCSSAPVFSDNDDERYLSCMKSFDCGTIRGAGYPFSGSDRPGYCGYPGFELSCRNQDPEITIMRSTYKLLGINSQSRTFNVSRTDYTENLCPTLLSNSSSSPNLLISNSDHAEVTLYYGCPSPIPAGFSAQFTCKINSTDMTGCFVTVNNSVLSMTAPSLITYLTTCNNSVIVPARQSALVSILGNPNEAQLLGAINQGFDLVWSANDSLCDTCKSSGGQCGYNQTTTAFTCYCADQPHDFDCTTPSTRSTNGTRQPWIVIATPTQSPTTSPVFHIRRRRKTLRMLLSKKSDARWRVPRREDQSEVEEEDPLPEKGVRKKLKDLFVSSPPFEQKERRAGERGGGEEVGLISGGGGGASRRGGAASSLRPVAASFRYRLLRRAWRPVLVTIPE